MKEKKKEDTIKKGLDELFKKKIVKNKKDIKEEKKEKCIIKEEMKTKNRTHFFILERYYLFLFYPISMLFNQID